MLTLYIKKIQPTFNKTDFVLNRYFKNEDMITIPFIITHLPCDWES